MSESRDANDPRDLLRAMRKEARDEFEREEAGDTGGREHVTPAEAESGGIERGALREESEEIERLTEEQSDAGVLRVPGGAPATGGGRPATGGPLPDAGGAPRERGEK